mmetsp:Transcript_16808/g.34235  ORF Transcript_16808/g.34235 Transcript_16808/m.34235 type:complete len:310 (+) Transcript_16808:33-962(+)
MSSLRSCLVVLALASQIENADAFTSSKSRWVPSSKLEAVTLEKNSDGLEFVSLAHPSGAKSEIYLLGGVPTKYTDADGTDWIAVRPDAKMDGSKPISGGLSHCFPQFGPGEIQQHGFARNVPWSVASMGEDSVTLKLEPSDYSKAMWDVEFEATLKVSLTASSLDTELVVANKGSDEFAFQAALHSYFDLSDIKDVSVAGSFKGAEFLNKMLDPPATQVEDRSELLVAEEYDRVYMGVNDCVLKDSGKGKALKIVNGGGWKDTVVWSPYGNEGMGYKNFMCIESVAFDKVALAGGKEWSATLSLVPTKL